tara:strand:- start:2849 stop:3034 length:186 start_codon:yes stop_codon:yes gene_type:complete
MVVKEDHTDALLTSKDNIPETQYDKQKDGAVALDKKNKYKILKQKMKQLTGKISGAIKKPK